MTPTATAGVAGRGCSAPPLRLARRRKRTSKGIANAWSSLRHFRAFPEDKKIPCLPAGSRRWIRGNLYHCGDVNRDDCSNNVVRRGRTALRDLKPAGCAMLVRSHSRGQLHVGRSSTSCFRHWAGSNSRHSLMSQAALGIGSLLVLGLVITEMARGLPWMHAKF
jgi:hypothetical protein